MFGRMASFMYRRRWQVVGVWCLLFVIAVALASQVGSVLGPGDFTQKGSDSEKASILLDRKFHQSDQKTLLVVLHSNSGNTVGDASFRRAVNMIQARIRADRNLRVTFLENPIVAGNNQFISRDRSSIALLVSSSLNEQDLEGQIDPLRSVVKYPGFVSYVTGTAAQNHDYAVSSKSDLSVSESITVPILIIILLLVFGTLVASALPILLAALSIVLSLALVYVFGHVIDTSVYVTNVVTALGLGIGIDYSLFIVYRFREELRAAGDDVAAAVVRTMETTGRAIFFSGVTVTIGLSSLILTRESFMVSLGLGGILVPLTSLLVAMSLLPAVLGLLGTRVNRFQIMPARFRRTDQDGFWHWLATTIMARPVVCGGIAMALLLGLAYPVTQLNLAFGGLANAPKSIESIAGYIYMRDNFPSVPNPIQIVVTARKGSDLLAANQLGGLRVLEAAIRRDPQTVKVVGPPDFVSSSGGRAASIRSPKLLAQYLDPAHDTATISVISRHEVGVASTEGLVRRIRSLTSHAVFTSAFDHVYVGGAQAGYTDFNDALYSNFPQIIAIVLILTYGFLFYAFRSVFVPLKAVVLNLLSVGAAYGALQLVFQRGAGASLLQITPESGVAPWVPIFLFAFLFGLSMDYEVFLLSRIRERWLATKNNQDSVVFGIEKTGRLITSAAAVMVVAFGGFLIGHQVQLKEFGFGLMSSIAIDATLIRLVLVPSIMKIAGPVNWWVPAFLREFASRDAPTREGFADEMTA